MLLVVDLLDGVEYMWCGVGCSVYDDVVVFGVDGVLIVFDEVGVLVDLW